MENSLYDSFQSEFKRRKQKQIIQTIKLNPVKTSFYDTHTPTQIHTQINKKMKDFRSKPMVMNPFHL